MKFARYIITASTLFSLAYADANDAKKEKKMKEAPPKPDCSLSLPCTEKHAMFDVFGEYLYWQVKEDQLNFAADVEGGLGSIIEFFTSGTSPFGSFTPEIKIKEADSRWHSGWRVGAGFFLECSTWDVQAFWTHLHDNTHTSISDPLGGIFPLEFPVSSLFAILGENPPNLLTGATNSWNFKFDTADLQLGRSFFVKTASFRPFIGLRGARIYQHLNTSYFGATLNISSTDVPDVVGVGIGNKKKNNFLAGGPSFGVDSGWQFAKGWTISNEFSFAFLYGRFKTALHSLVNIPDTIDATVSVTDNFHRLRPMAEGRIGVDWRECFGDYFLINIGAAYEVEYWWNQWQAPSSVELGLINASSSPQGDLMLHGLVVHLGLAF